MPCQVLRHIKGESKSMTHADVTTAGSPPALPSDARHAMPVTERRPVLLAAPGLIALQPL